MPPADFDSLRGERGRFVCCSVALFRCGGRLVVLVAFLEQCVTENIHASTAYIKIAMAIKKIRRATS